MQSSADIQIDYQKREVKKPAAAGEICFRTNVSQRSGRCFYTDWIDTELGRGRHALEFFLIDSEGFDEMPIRKERLIFGDPHIFDQSAYIPAVPEVKMGACLETETGRFRLGVQLVHGMTPGAFRVAWRAQKEEQLSEKEGAAARAQQFYIANPPKYLRPGMKYTFSCHRSEGLSEAIEWKVAGENAGGIDVFGTYTAPERAGIFEIQAALKESGLSASVYVVVKE